MASMLGGLGGGREYVLKIIADVKDAVKGVDQVATQTTSMKDKMIGVGKAVATGLAAAAVVDFGKDCINAAADADDAMDAVESAFGSASDTILNFSKTTADKMGLSAQDYQTMAAETGRILTGFGVNNTDAANMTNTLAERAADMAAIVGGSTEDAMSAMGKAMQGQTKGLKQYQVSISKAEVDARAMAMGYVDASGKVTDAGRAIATQDLILEKTSKYQGEFAKNSKDLGSQQAIMAAKMEDLKTTIGNALLPVMIKLFDLIRPMMDFISKNIGWIAPLAGAIMAIVAAVKLWNIAQLVLNSTLLANPIFQVVAAIAALVAGLVWAYNNVGWFRDAVDAMAAGVVAAFNWIKDIVVGVFNWVRDNWPLLLAILTGPFGTAVYLIIQHWDTIKDAILWLFNWIKDNWPLLLAILTGPFGLAVLAIVKNWDTIKEAILGVFNWIKDNWPLLLAILTGPFGLAVLAIQRNWDSIKSAASTAIDTVRNALGDVANIISIPFQKGADLAKAAWNGLMDLIRGAWNTINNALSGIKNVITYPFEQAINAIKSLWNNTIGKFSFSVPSWVPGIGGKGWSMPRMASGGIVNKPTVALIGEAGPEAVIPLNSRNTAGLAAPVTLNVYALTANAEVGRLVFNALRDYERTSGATLFAPTSIPRNF
jgi:hypothetical protein